ncbi:hypothetical protein SteCoe_13926 [Stentor coeruleus]|uniref:RING-type domain-containing protein n=1 Tax=Stentor coeruleus TaxID=5963 RepID=A0A1R2C7A0_9CILI|nr:hypothetical protein SteCoe_13926 [Stentor coeruleus]
MGDSTLKDIESLEKVICDYCEESEGKGNFECEHNFCEACIGLLVENNVISCPMEKCLGSDNICKIHKSEYILACIEDYQPLCQYCDEDHEGHNKRNIEYLNAFTLRLHRNSEKNRPKSQTIVEHSKVLIESLEILKKLSDKVDNLFKRCYSGLQIHDKINEVRKFEEGRKNMSINIEYNELFIPDIKGKIALSKYLKNPEELQDSLVDAEESIKKNQKLLENILENLISFIDRIRPSGI